jgi:hypothetical protein
MWPDQPTPNPEQPILKTDHFGQFQLRVVAGSLQAVGLDGALAQQRNRRGTGGAPLGMCSGGHERTHVLRREWCIALSGAHDASPPHRVQHGGGVRMGSAWREPDGRHRLAVRDRRVRGLEPHGVARLCEVLETGTERAREFAIHRVHRRQPARGIATQHESSGSVASAPCPLIAPSPRGPRSPRPAADRHPARCTAAGGS